MSKAIELAGTILQKLGVEDDVIAILKGTDDSKIAELKADEIVSTVVETQKEIIVADPTVTDPIIAQAKLTFFGKREDELIKQFGEYITKEEMNALPKADRYDQAMKLLAKKIKAAKAGDNPDDKDKKIEQLSAELEQRQEELRKVREEEIPGVQKDWENKMTEREIAQEISSLFGGFKAKLIADSELLFPAVNTSLRDKYDIKKEDGKIVLYEKGKTVKALKNSKPLSVNDALEELATPLFKKSEDPPKKDPIREDPPQPKKKTIGATKFEEALAAKKAAMEAAGQGS